ncbi:MAG TPA: PEGA domain-containing protein [Polyangiaceae bacterium]|nr:PEGA domain-containing protein [Polyangiaceae bacterium]
MTRSLFPHRRPLRKAVAWLLGASLCAASAPPLWAQGAPPAPNAPKAGPGPGAGKPLSEEQRKVKAREAYNDAEAKLNAGDFGAALERYRAAHEFAPSAQNQYKIAYSLDKLGRGAEALDAYKAFLAEPPQQPDKLAEQRKLAEARVAELGEASVKVSSSPPGAAIAVDGTPQAAQTPTTLKLKPGRHTVAVSAGGFEPMTREIDVPAGGAPLDVAVDLKPLAPPPPPPPAASAPSNVAATEPEAPRSKLPAYVTLGLAGTGLVVGTIFGAQALSNKSTFDDDPTTDNADRAERNALIADMAFGVALTLGVTGAVLLFSSPEKPAPATKAAAAGGLRLLPVLTPQTQGAAATLRF